MTARSVLNMVADDLCSDGMNGETIGDRDAAALRELDQLLQSSLEIMREAIANGDWKVDGRCDPDSLFRRLAQAGYGDK